MSFMEPFEVYGEWWVPEKPDEKYNGKLSYDSVKGLQLDLPKVKMSHRYGRKTTIALKGMKKYLPNAISLSSPIPIDISYFDSNDASYTLLKSELLTGLVSMAIKCSSGKVKLKHKENNDELAPFKSISYPKYQIIYSGLQEWVQSYFSRNDSYDKTIYLDKAHLNIRKIDEKAVCFELSPRKSNFITLYKAAEVIDNLRNFLMCASENHIILNDIKAIDINNQEYALYWHNLEMKLPPPTDYNWVFDLNDVADNLPGLIKKFCDKYKILAPLKNNYLRHRYIIDRDSYFHEVQFLSYVQGLEGFFKRHSFKLPKTAKSLEDYIKEDVLPLRSKDSLQLSEIDQNLQRIVTQDNRSLETILFYLFCTIAEKTEFDSIKKLFTCWNKDHKAFGQPLPEHLENIRVQKNLDPSLAKCLLIFSAKITDLRNKLTHEAVHSLKIWDVYDYNKRLGIVILLLIYLELNLDMQIIRKLMYKL